MNGFFKDFSPAKFYGLDEFLFNPTFDLEYRNPSPLKLTRGGYAYSTPFVGWKRYALNVNSYDNKKNEWIRCDGNPSEWAVAYHGLRRDVLCSVKGIVKNGFNVYTGKNSQWGSHDEDVGPNKHLFPTKNCEIGVYCTPQLKFLIGDNNCERAHLLKPIPYNNKYHIQTVLQCRVKPTSIRMPRCAQDQYYIINNPKHIRVYGILVNFLENQEAEKIFQNVNFNLSPISCV